MRVLLKSLHGSDKIYRILIKICGIPLKIAERIEGAVDDCVAGTLVCGHAVALHKAHILRLHPDIVIGVDFFFCLVPINSVGLHPFTFYIVDYHHIAVCHPLLFALGGDMLCLVGVETGLELAGLGVAFDTEAAEVELVALSGGVFFVAVALKAGGCHLHRAVLVLKSDGFHAVDGLHRHLLKVDGRDVGGGLGAGGEKEEDQRSRRHSEPKRSEGEESFMTDFSRGSFAIAQDDSEGPPVAMNAGRSFGRCQSFKDSGTISECGL